MSAADDAKFCRLYYNKFQREFPAIYADDAAFAAWTRLLAVAEAMWPLVPEVPRSTKAKPLARLVSAGLVIRDGAYGFRIRGLDAERIRRGNAARKAAGIRWSNADGDAPADARADANAYADASAPAMPSRDETRRDENSPPPPVGRRKDGTNARSLGTNPRAKGESPRQVRAAAKRGGGDSLGEILRRAAAAGHDS